MTTCAIWAYNNLKVTGTSCQTPCFGRLSHFHAGISLSTLSASLSRYGSTERITLNRQQRPEGVTKNFITTLPDTELSANSGGY